MMIHEITIHAGKYKTRKRIGRGEGSGHGKTAGRGHKGAASRSGWKRRPGYEGGQMPIFRRMPKRGFTNAPFRRLFHVVNVKQLEARFDDGATVTRESLAEAGLIRDTSLPLKVLGEGTLSKKLNVTAARFSATAKTKIEEAGGKGQSAGFDVTDTSAVHDSIGSLAPDILVNNVGNTGAGNRPGEVTIRISPFVESDPADWEGLFAVNLFGVMHCTRAALPVMVERGWGRLALRGIGAGV